MVSIHGFRPLPCLKPGHRRYVYVLLKECASFAQRLLSVRGIVWHLHEDQQLSEGLANELGSNRCFKIINNKYLTKNGL